MSGDGVWLPRSVPYRPLRKQLGYVDDSYAGRKTPSFGNSSFSRLFKPSPRPTNRVCSNASKEINDCFEPLGRRHQGANAFKQMHTAHDILAQRKDSKLEIRRAKRHIPRTEGESWRTMGIFSETQEPYTEKLRTKRAPCRAYTDRESPILGDEPVVKEKARSSVRVSGQAHATSNEMMRAMVWKVSRPADTTPCCAVAQTPPLCAAQTMNTSLISKRTPNPDPNAPSRCSGSQRPVDHPETSSPNTSLQNPCVASSRAEGPPADNIWTPHSNGSVNSSNSLQKATTRSGSGGKGPARSQDNCNSISEASKISKSASCASLMVPPSNKCVEVGHAACRSSERPARSQDSGGSISKASKMSKSVSCASFLTPSSKKGSGVGHVAYSSGRSSRKTPFNLSARTTAEKQNAAPNSKTYSASSTHSTVNSGRMPPSARSGWWEPFGGLKSEKYLCCSHD